MNPYDSLSEDERIRRIGDLLATAAIRYLREKDQQLASRKAQSPPPAPILHVWDLVDDEVEKQMLRYLSQNIGALPIQMERALNLPHTTLVRRLARLRLAGLVVVSGRTRGAQYSLASGNPHH